MPYPRPTQTTLDRQMEADIAAEFPDSGGVVRKKSPTGIIGKAQSIAIGMLYAFIEWLRKQLVPWTATSVYLEAWARLVGVTRRFAEPAKGDVTITGTNDAVLPAASVLKAPGDIAYRTDADATISGGSATVGVTAIETGVSGNLPASIPLRIFNLPTGINGTVTHSGISGGAEQEDDDSLRSRMLIRYANVPRGGAITDYVQWSLQVPSVSHAWARHGENAGTVDVYALFNNEFPTGTSGAATDEYRESAKATGDLLLLANHLYPLRPATALVYAVAPVPYAVDITIAALSNDTPQVRAQIIAALRNVLLQNADPLGGSIYQSQFEAAILSAVPGARYAMTVPTGITVSAPVGELPTLGEVTFT